MNKMSITVKWRNVKDGVGLSSKEGFDFLEDMIPAVLDKLPRILLFHPSKGESYPEPGCHSLTFASERVRA
jgi:hypothetical protein